MATTSFLTAVENKIPSVSNLVKKINEIADHNHDKYITTPKIYKLTAENFAARLEQANLERKSHIVNFVNKTDFEKK